MCVLSHVRFVTCVPHVRFVNFGHMKQVADRDSLGIAEAQAKARALVPSVNVPTSFSGMMKAVISLSRSKRYKSVAKAATSYTPVGPRLNPKVAGIAVIAAGSGTGGSGANSAAGGGGGGGSSASGVLSGSATPLSARSGGGAGGNKALLTARSGDGGATSARSGDGGGGKSAELPSTPGRLPSTPGRLTSRSDGQTSASGSSVGGGDTTASKANKTNKKRGGALVPWYALLCNLIEVTTTYSYPALVPFSTNPLKRLIPRTILSLALSL